ncbi:putative glycosyltransferase [Caenibius tardaugens NBRC 16725]|uniref:Putative glycosyltransferase n=1 Tax=Caenibius tardaugens NBRC 16725 TaxID=1219035 RepID=U2Y6J3_9SPHN|nr:glycosyltransferase [Caenibius tardaugens]AZI36129.1 glycosyltransferase [Caenibius tardaugens NBRC 16725]GAD48786.1 putative glycosyltransferase [Caenibius tardaugens NBRC 16725]
MLSIGIFVHNLAATGVVRNAIAIAQHMQQAGWDVRLLLCYDNGDLAGQAASIKREVLLDASRNKRSRSLAMAYTIPRLRASLQRNPPDILLSAGNHAHLPCLLASRGLRKPQRVYRISNDLTHQADGLRSLPGAIRRRLVARAIIRDGAQVVMVSPGLAQEPVLARALDAGKAQIIRNGVPLDKIAAQKTAPCDHPWFAEDIPVVIAVGRLVEQKNFPTLMRAVAEARRTRDLRLLLLGGGKAGNRAELERLGAQLGLSDSLDFVGRIANPFPYVARAATLVLPSLWEGSANVLLEAMACDTPVVASATAGNAAEVLDNGRYGILVDPMDIQAMARAILQQCDPATRVAPGRRAAEFDIRTTLGSYQRLFSDVLAANQVSPAAH